MTRQRLALALLLKPKPEITLPLSYPPSFLFHRKFVLHVLYLVFPTGSLDISLSASTRRSPQAKETPRSR